MFKFVGLCNHRAKEREKSTMRNTFLYKSHASSSSICKALINETMSRKLNWISCEKFIDFLEVQGISFDNISWFYAYLSHIQSVRHYPSYSETFFAFYDDRLFAISQSKIFRELRIDFTSSFDISIHFADCRYGCSSRFFSCYFSIGIHCGNLAVLCFPDNFF